MIERASRGMKAADDQLKREVGAPMEAL